jgi:DnaK suppressor protein
MQSTEQSEPLLTEQEVVDAPESEYMSDEQLAFFRQRLIDLHDSTRDRIRQAKEQMSQPIELGDETDRATWEEQCAISMRIVDREQKLLPKIQQSLERIRHGTYGYCMESGDPIGIPRLLIRPTAEYCADIKIMKEMKEHLYRD